MVHGLYPYKFEYDRYIIMYPVRIPSGGPSNIRLSWVLIKVLYIRSLGSYNELMIPVCDSSA